jgi:hypothetical protein
LAFEQLAVNRFLLFILFRPVSSRDGKFIITISIQQWENNQPSLNDDDVPEKLDVYVLVGHYFTKGKLGNWFCFFLKISFINYATIYDGNDGRKCPVIPLSLLLFVSYVCLITTRVGNSPWLFSSRCCTGILVFPFHFLWYLSLDIPRDHRTRCASRLKCIAMFIFGRPCSGSETSWREMPPCVPRCVVVQYRLAGWLTRHFLFPLDGGQGNERSSTGGGTY